MVDILMIRHAQAARTGGPADHAPLTPLGRAQARAIGAHLVRIGFRPDQLWTGPARRHRDAAALIMEALAGYPPNEALLGLGEGAGQEADQETGQEAARRAIAIIRAEAEAIGAERVLAVASAEPIAATALAALGAPGARLAVLARRMPHGALSVFAAAPGDAFPEIVSLNAFGFLQAREDGNAKLLTYD